MSEHPKPTAASAGTTVRFVLQDPAAFGRQQRELTVPARAGQTLLETALAHGLIIEHACGGVCACATCHVRITEGAAQLNEPDDRELDQVDQAPQARPDSRLACQARIEREGAHIVCEVPAWNRNAVRESHPGS